MGSHCWTQEKEIEPKISHFKQLNGDDGSVVVDQSAHCPKSEGLNHRDKTKVQMKLLCWLFMGPHSWF
jgi:hypothetical protein